MNKAQIPPELRSKRGKEKFADSLLALSNGVLTALFVVVLVLPLTALFAAVLAPAGKPFSLIDLLLRAVRAEPVIGVVVVLLVFYLGTILWMVLLRERALDIYDLVSREEADQGARLPARRSS